MQKSLLILLTSAFAIFSFPASYSRSTRVVDLSMGVHFDGEPELLEIGQARAPARPRHSSPEIKVVSYNIRWRSGEDLRKLARFLKEDPEIGGAAILGLQEVDRNKKRSGNRNTAALLAEELGMYYAWAAPPSPATNKEEETGVVILSAYPLTDVRRLVLPHEGPGGRRRSGAGSDCKNRADRDASLFRAFRDPDSNSLQTRADESCPR